MAIFSQRERCGSEKTGGSVNFFYSKHKHIPSIILLNCTEQEEQIIKTAEALKAILFEFGV